jgi:Ca2+/H+ antiporter
MNHDYVIFVFPRPWAWLSLACFAVVIAMYAAILWRQRRARRALIKYGEGLADRAMHAGLPEQVKIFEAGIAELQRKPWGLGAVKTTPGVAAERFTGFVREFGRSRRPERSQGDSGPKEDSR